MTLFGWQAQARTSMHRPRTILTSAQFCLFCETDNVCPCPEELHHNQLTFCWVVKQVLKRVWPLAFQMTRLAEAHTRVANKSGSAVRSSAKKVRKMRHASSATMHKALGSDMYR